MKYFIKLASNAGFRLNGGYYIKRFFITMIIAISFNAAVQANTNDAQSEQKTEPLYLICSGDSYLFTNKPGKPETFKDTTIIVKLDRETSIMHVSFYNSGKIDHVYETTPELYRITAEYNNMTLQGKKIKSLEFWVSRITGEATAMYKTESGDGGYIAFNGKCEPGKVKF